MGRSSNREIRRVPGDAGDEARERGVVGRADGEQAVGELHAEDRLAGRAERAASRRSSEERIVNVCGRSVMSRRISRKSPEAASRPATITSTLCARRSTSSRMCDENRIVRPWRASVAEQLHHVQPLARVHAVERLVEQQDLRVVHEGRRRPSTRWRMPLEYVAIGRSAASSRSTVWMAARAAASGSASPWRRRVEPDELEAGEEREERLALRARGRSGGRRLRVPPRRPAPRTLTRPDRRPRAGRPRGGAASTCRRRSARGGR